jgi:hypothetical protein
VRWRSGIFALDLDAAQEPIKMDAFNAVVDREMSAQTVAFNERLHAPNIKNVVAYDEFGDRSAENIADFLRFLPGSRHRRSSPDRAVGHAARFSLQQNR